MPADSRSSKNLSMLWESLPNFAGSLDHESSRLPISYLELSRPTGKYIARIWLSAVNFFFKKGFIRVVGNTCVPGLLWPELSPINGMKQFEKSASACGALVVNVKNHLPYRDAVSFVAEPYMVFKVRPEWNNLGDALQAMSSKYRVRNQKVLKSTPDLEWRELQDLPTAEWLSTCGLFLQRTLSERTVAMTGNLNELLWQYHRILKDDFKVRGYYLNQKLVGFVSYVIEGSEWHAIHMGLDPTVAESQPLYQRIFLDLIDSAVASGAQRLYMGRTATEIKSSMGAEAIDNQFLVFVKYPWLRFLTRLYQRWIYQSPPYTLRRPFK